MFYMYVYAYQVGVLKLYLPVVIAHILLTPSYHILSYIYIYMYLPGFAVMLDRWSNSPVTVSSHAYFPYSVKSYFLVVYMYAILE